MAGYIGSKASVVSSGAEHKKVFDITTTTTSLTGLVYTPTLVHVFHNGVRLVDGTDYTATSGTTITLTVAAENGDQVVVISYATFQTSDTVSASAGGTFAGAVTVQGAFTSLGIDDNATSTAMTIDSSENVLVGKTSIGLSTTGIDLRSTGLLQAIRDGGTVVELNRQTTDGTIIDLRKDNTTVGSIGTYSNGTFEVIAETANFHLRPNGGTNSTGNVVWSQANVQPWSDGYYDVGSSPYRFKNLYLSGGVYLGGTGAANKLDDYEEGDWVPTFAGLAPTSITSAKYVKVGSLVFFSTQIVTPSTGSTSGMYIGGLPFGTAADSSASMAYTTSADFSPAMLVQGTFVYFYKASGASYTMANYSNVQLRLSGHYYTTA